MTEDQEIISSGSPHEVHLAEGSHTALHKSAAATQPQIRNTLANPHAEVELIEIVQGVSQSTAEKKEAADVLVHEDEPAAQREHLMPGVDGRAENLSRIAPLLPSVDAPHLEVPPMEVPASDAPPKEVPLLAPVPTALPLTDSKTPEAVLSSPAPATQEALAHADSIHASGQTNTKPVHLGEMSFPARVVKLKIANEQIRVQIEKLEIPLFSPIAVTASVAKGKHNAPAPAKGH